MRVSYCTEYKRDLPPFSAPVFSRRLTTWSCSLSDSSDDMSRLARVVSFVGASPSIPGGCKSVFARWLTPNDVRGLFNTPIAKMRTSANSTTTYIRAMSVRHRTIRMVLRAHSNAGLELHQIVLYSEES